MNMEENTSFPSFEQNDDDNGLSAQAKKIGIGVGVILVIALLVLVIILLLNHPATTETLRDLFIIVLALESLVIGTLLVVLVFQLITLTRMLRDEIKPMIESTQETVNIAKGTTTFVSQQVTRPAIEVLSYTNGIARSIGVLIQMLPRRRSVSKPGKAEEGD